jgi:uncharacterized protein YdhG (YjbR/CyaY superfamily)
VASTAGKRAAPEGAAAVRSYITRQPDKARVALKAIRSAIKAAAPKGDEVISYGIPAYCVNDRVLIYYAGWKNHVSLYPMTPAIRRAFAADIKGLKVAKGTIQFPLTKAIPVPLVRRLVRARLAELRARGR